MTDRDRRLLALLLRDDTLLPCDRTMTCTCINCQQQRTRLIQEAPKRRRRIKQPWDVRHAA